MDYARSIGCAPRPARAATPASSGWTSHPRRSSLSSARSARTGRRPGNLVNATIEGAAHKPGDEFTYRDRAIEHCRFRVNEIVPERRATWQVLDSHLTWVDDENEWNGTQVIFELTPERNGTWVRFTHRA